MISTTGLVLCGGLGTRLRSAIGDLPKVLAPVAGIPFLHYLLRYLHSQGVSDVVLCVGYQAKQVMDYCQDGARWGVQIHYSREIEPLGTGGAIKQAESFITSDPFLVLNGDSLLPVNIAGLIDFYVEKRALISMALTEVTDKTRYGSVSLADGGELLGFNEKENHGSGFINAGIYLMNRAVLETIPQYCNISLERDVFPRFVGVGLYGMVASGHFIDIGVPESYAMAQDILADCAWSSRA